MEEGMVGEGKGGERRVKGGGKEGVGCDVPRPGHDQRSSRSGIGVPSRIHPTGEMASYPFTLDNIIQKLYKIGENGLNRSLSKGHRNPPVQ